MPPPCYGSVLCREEPVGEAAIQLLDGAILEGQDNRGPAGSGSSGGPQKQDLQSTWFTSDKWPVSPGAALGSAVHWNRAGFHLTGPGH